MTESNWRAFNLLRPLAVEIVWRQRQEVATQSANQGIERMIRTEHWSWKDRCLPAHRSYCEAAAWSVIAIMTMFGKHGLFFVGFSFSFTGGRTVFASESGVKQRRWTKWTFRAWLTDKTFRHYKTTVFSVGGAPFPLTLMIVWETFKMIKYMVYWLEWIYLLIASLCNVGDNVYFSTDLLNSLPV